MIKTVRKRPVHNTHFGARKGVIYLPKHFISTKIKVMTEGQWKQNVAMMKHLKRKMAVIREISHYVYLGN